MNQSKKLASWQKKSICRDGNIELSYTCDLAVFSLVKILAQVNKHSNIRAYRDHYDLKRHIPGFKVSVQSFMHKGKVFEGTIGSYYKIDASYLSQDVYYT